MQFLDTPRRVAEATKRALSFPMSLVVGIVAELHQPDTVWYHGYGKDENQNEPTVQEEVDYVSSNGWLRES